MLKIYEKLIKINSLSTYREDKLKISEISVIHLALEYYVDLNDYCGILVVSNYNSLEICMSTRKELTSPSASHLKHFPFTAHKNLH